MKVYQEYWKHYGGLRSLLESRYLWFSAVFTLLCVGFWTDLGWWDLVIGIIPSMLGFSLGGYAIFLAFGDRRFQRFTSEENENGASVYAEASATFFHFILMQVSALGASVFAKALPLASVAESDFPPQFWTAQSYAATLASGIAFGLFVYAVVSALATSAALFKLSLVYHQWLLSDESRDNGAG